jgi:hypothetical protein
MYQNYTLVPRPKSSRITGHTVRLDLAGNIGRKEG